MSSKMNLRPGNAPWQDCLMVKELNPSKNPTAVALGRLGERLNGRGDELARAFAGGIGGAAPKLVAGVGPALRRA
jgi:hypothetical protein